MTDSVWFEIMKQSRIYVKVLFKSPKLFLQKFYTLSAFFPELYFSVLLSLVEFSILPSLWFLLISTTFVLKKFLSQLLDFISPRLRYFCLSDFVLNSSSLKFLSVLFECLEISFETICFNALANGQTILIPVCSEMFEF